ncbi:MAG TPA: hypothetical protein VFV99_05805 [Kofleriaceae bacterium]|nr:hypothetical protein [Kofleriaceae bacterium]
MFACGGDDGGGGNGNPDAKVFMDSKVFMDAPGGGGGLTGLGQKCGSGQPACPTNAPDCIALGLGGGSASTSYCTPHCLEDGSGTTNAQGQLTTTTPAPDNAKCSAVYTGGSVGMPACGVILATTPMDNPLKANTSYTMIDLGCVIVCGTGMMCPTGTTATTAGSTCFCFPN